MLRLLAAVLAYVALFFIFLFVPAGTLHWWRAWVFLAVLFAAQLIGDLYIASVNKGLLAERRKLPVQNGQPLGDKILVILFMGTFAELVAFTAYDVFHLQLLPKPGVVISSAGIVLFIVGLSVVSLSLATNAFAVTVVRHQPERHHRLIDTGVYSVVRHPMYSGLIGVLVGMCLWLESYAGALAASVPIGILVLRIVVEERFLRQKLAGYDDYIAKVRWRLVPELW